MDLLETWSTPWAIFERSRYCCFVVCISDTCFTVTLRRPPSLSSIHHRSESQTAARVSPSDNRTAIMSQQIPNTQMAVVVHGKGQFC